MKFPALHALWCLWQRRHLFMQLARRDIESRYRGSFFGLLWAFFNPLLMLTVYTLAFRVFLGLRWPHMASSGAFSLMIFCGMVVHSAMMECITRASMAIVSKASLVKRVVFPLPMLPCVTVVSTLFNMLLGVLVLLVFVLLMRHALPVTVLYLPVVYAPFVLLLYGVALFMASVGVFVRDVMQITQLLSSVLMFLSPVFYPASNLHEPFRSLIRFNPLTLMIEQTRAVVLYGHPPAWGALGLYALLALLFFGLGYVWFEKTRDVFADVL